MIFTATLLWRKENPSLDKTNGIVPCLGMLIKSCWMLATYEGMTVTVSAWRPKLLPNWNLRYVWLYLVSSGRHVLFTINSVQLFTSCSWYWKILIEERLLSSKWNQYIIKGILWNAFCFEKQAFQIYFVFLTSEGLFLKKKHLLMCFFFLYQFSGIMKFGSLAHSLQENIRQQLCCRE